MKRRMMMGKTEMFLFTLTMPMGNLTLNGIDYGRVESFAREFKKGAVITYSLSGMDMYADYQGSITLEEPTWLVMHNYLTLDPPNGIYILRANRLYTPDEWDAYWNNEAVGAAVVTDNCRFVVAPTENSSIQKWSPNKALVPGVTTVVDGNAATVDYNGVQNTDALVAFYGSNDDYAAGWCRNYIFKNGKNGYLGSLGEWYEVEKNKAEVDACLRAMGGVAIPNVIHWSSTQESKDYAWRLYMSKLEVSRYSKTNYQLRVRAFAAL